jgi:hypothetical protein
VEVGKTTVWLGGSYPGSFQTFERFDLKLSLLFNQTCTFHSNIFPVDSTDTSHYLVDSHF